MATVTGSSGDDTLYGGSSDDVVFGGDGGDTIYSGLGNDSVEGGAGDDTIYGGNGDDIVIGGAGNDTLYGGAENDTFVAEFKFGNDVIDDFVQTKDAVSLRSANVNTFADVQARMSDIGGSTLITFDDGSTLTINGKVPGELSASNFAIGSPICFTPGTLIATPDGERPVEDLAVGDVVSTRDGGPQAIRWIGVSHHAWPASPEKHKPIQIKAGALGGGLPRRDLAVSPQHRMLVSGAQVRALFGVDEVLAPAKGLISLPGVRVMKGKRCVSYISILLGAHHLLTAEGAVTESFYPGPTALKMVPVKAALQIVTLFPGVSKAPEKVSGPTARPVLSVSDARRLSDALRREAEYHRWDEDLARDQAPPHLRIVS